MVRPLFLTTIIISMFGSESALSKPAACARAYAELELKQAEYFANPPTATLRMLAKNEVTVTPLNGGASFKHEYEGDLANFWRPGFSAGVELNFKNSAGRNHSLKIIGKSTRPAQIEAVTEMVLRLPAETLEATKLVEVQTFVGNTGASGYAIKNGFVLLENGAREHVVRHEFGHNLAELVWGSAHPYKNWEKAFVADGSNFVSPYAKSSFTGSKYVEDFAEAVEGYLRDADGFRKTSPNRAAILDTIFRDGDLWQPIRDHNGTILARVTRGVQENPGAAVSTLLLTGAVAGGGAAIVYVTKLPPIPQENPR